MHCEKLSLFDVFFETLAENVFKISLFDNVSYYRKLRVVTLPKFSESNADNMKERALGVFFVLFNYIATQ